MPEDSECCIMTMNQDESIQNSDTLTRQPLETQMHIGFWFLHLVDWSST